MVSDKEVCMKQRCVIEFLHVEKKKLHRLTLIDVLNIYVNTVRWWVVCFSSGDNDSGSPPLVHIFMSLECGLLFNAGKNAQLIMVTVLKNNVFYLRIYQIVCCALSICVVSTEIYRRHYFQSNLHTCWVNQRISKPV